MTTFETALHETARHIDDTLAFLLPEGDRDAEGRLYEAMRYATLAGGKRLRPFFTVVSASLFDVAETRAYRVGAAVEMVHTYSLVHDDLPAMDNDELRRGRPTCHRQFDEATAILTGDSLLTLAFEILCEPETHPDASVRCALIDGLAKAAGGRGMVGGQMIDLSAETVPITRIEDIARLQRLKTGRLFDFSCEAGAMLGNAPDAARRALLAYAHDIGLAFQIVDDLLDIEGDEVEMGKAVGKDTSAGKATFVSLLGVDSARNKAVELTEKAITHLSPFGERAALLRDAAHFVLERRN